MGECLLTTRTSHITRAPQLDATVRRHTDATLNACTSPTASTSTIDFHSTTHPTPATPRPKNNHAHRTWPYPQGLVPMENEAVPLAQKVASWSVEHRLWHPSTHTHTHTQTYTDTIFHLVTDSNQVTPRHTHRLRSPRQHLLGIQRRPARPA